MNKPRHLLTFISAAFGNTGYACEGDQIARVVAVIAQIRPDLDWYVADVETVGGRLVAARKPTPERMGDASVLASAARSVQFLSGVFAAVPRGIAHPRFRDGGLWTEDEEDADVGDAVIET